MQTGARQARIDGKRDLSRISKLLLWMALSSLLLLMYSTARCQGCGDRSALPGVRRRELACANWGHQSTFSEAWLGMREHFFKRNEKYNSKQQWQFLFLMGKKSILKKRFFSVEGRILEFNTFSFLLSETSLKRFLLFFLKWQKNLRGGKDNFPHVYVFLKLSNTILQQERKKRGIFFYDNSLFSSLIF